MALDVAAAIRWGCHSVEFAVTFSVVLQRPEERGEYRCSRNHGACTLKVAKDSFNQGYSHLPHGISSGIRGVWGEVWGEGDLAVPSAIAGTLGPRPLLEHCQPASLPIPIRNIWK